MGSGRGGAGIHGENNATTQNESGKPRGGASPEGGQLLLPKDASGAIERVFVLFGGLDGLHARLDGVQWHGDVTGRN